MTDNPSPSSDLTRVVIFGGAGFIGRHLTEFFNSEYSVGEIVLADIAAPTWRLPKNVVFRTCDVREPIDPAIGEAELIVNLAAVHRTPGHPDDEYHDTNEHGAESIVNFATASGTRRIWFTSSIAVYGPDEAPKTEASEPLPISAYGKSKLAAEGIHRAWADPPENTLVISRPATVFGPGEGGNFTRLAKAMRRHTFFYPGRKDTLKGCGYVRDLGPAFAFMEQFSDPVSLFNFAYPEPPTIEDVCKAFSEQGGLPEPRFTVPAEALLGAGSVMDKAGLKAFNPERVKKLMHSTNVRGEELSSHGFEFEFDLQKAIADWKQDSPAGRFE
ncbi:MAG: NAD-dependent epimerase/dehydratase family protein [Solirubrobacterales bacterium]